MRSESAGGSDTYHPAMTSGTSPSDPRRGALLAEGEAASGPERHRMSCMEVWGGNRTTDILVRATGLDTRAFSLPYGGAARGGDVLHVTACSSGRITRALLADVVGHGEPAAEAAESLRRLMGEVVNILDQGKLVGALNREFTRLQEEGRFASAIVASYFRPTGTLTLCNAGHPPPLLYSEEEASWSFLEPRRGSSSRSRPLNLPLGFFGSVDYELQEIDLRRGDLVVLYTDGLIEATDVDGEEFGYGRLLDLLESSSPTSFDGVIPGVLGAIESWIGSSALADDISVMVFARNELKSSLQDEMLAPVRYLRHRFGGLRAGESDQQRP